MEISLHTNPFHFQYITDVYTEEELKLIWQELEFLNCGNKLLPSTETGPATQDGVELKKNTGVFLDSLYNDRNFSNILFVNRKLFSRNVLYNKNSWFFSNSIINSDFTLISYYENSDYYKPHYDTSRITACTWFFKEPKKFRGGNLYFVDYDIKIEIQNNSTVIFPSMIRHAVDEIHMNETDLNKGLGRYCMSQFIDYK